MGVSIDTVVTVLPLVYSAFSAATLYYLSKKPINLDQYESLRIHDESIAEHHSRARQSVATSAISPESTTTENIQAQYQVQRNAGMSINLARLGLTSVQLGLSLFSILVWHTASDEEDRGQRSTMGDIVQVVTWSYALALTFIHVIRPTVSHQFLIRRQLDLLYPLQWILASIHIYNTQSFSLPSSEWPLWLNLDVNAWAADLLLIWISLVTRPFQSLTAPKKLQNGKIPRSDSLEYSSSIYSQLTYSWISPLVMLGFKRPLQDVDLPNLEITDFSWFSVLKFKNTRGQTFTSRLLKALRWEFFIQFLWALPWCFLINASPYCMNKIIQYIECKTCGPPTAAEYSWVFGLFFASIFGSLAHQATAHIGRRIFVHTSSICNAEIFAKTLRRKDVAKSGDKSKDEGKNGQKNGDLNISNLVAVDIKKLELPFSYATNLYGYPIQFIIAGFQLYNLLGYASLVGIGFMIATYPIPIKIYGMIMKLFRGIMNTKDERMNALREMLSAIRILKFFGWESKFEEKITALREKELQQTKDSFIKILLADIVWMIMPLLNIIVILTAYTKLFGHDITASKMFTTLALFNIMRTALDFFPGQIRSSMQAIVSLRRINEFLQDEDMSKDIVVTKIDGKAHATSSSQPIIGFVNASFIWHNKENDQVKAKTPITNLTWIQKIKAKFSKTPKPTEEPVSEPEAVQERFRLKNISADFPINQLSLVVGPTGSGKSALLLALLGELERLDGHMYLPRLDYESDPLYEGGSSIAYVSQNAWLQNSTIRDNILFGKDFDQDRYDAVVEGCALITDFDILESGDKTEIGEQGITLSGGQKQRVALARAVYSDARILLLDDCLSAVDTHTGKHLFQTLTGPLLESRTVIMATHQVQLTLNAASFVLVLNKGEVLGSGTPQEVIRNQWVDNVTLATPVSDEDSEAGTLNGEDKDKAKKDKEKKKEKASVKLTQDEKKVEGAVSWKVYKTYFVASGGVTFWSGLVLLFLLRQFIDVGQNAWLAIWANKMAEDTGAFVIKSFQSLAPESLTLSVYSAFSPMDDSLSASIFGYDAPEKVNVNLYLGVYVLVCLGGMAFGAFTNYYVIFGGLAASRTLHQQLLLKLTRAQVRFYDTTPMGRIINRFSSDMATIDDQVSDNLQHLLSSIVTIVGIIFVISVNMPVFMIAAVFIVAIYVFIGAFYLPISRDLKRLNSNSRSPILNHFNETLNGIATIRAFGFEKRFQSKNLINVDDNNRTFFLLWTSSRWLAWRVDIAGAMVSFITGILVLQNWGKIAPGWAALSLTYSLMFTGTIVWIIRVYAMNEMNMNSVERVVEYIDLEEEPPAIIEGSRPPASWPHAGEIVVEHLTMRYAPDTPEVIKDISFSIKAGEKVGVVGRTGSGKSTLAISLFRFMDPAKGTITIDGIDICKIGLHDLRSNLTIIPQDPILFKGTLRSNLDPFGEREDKELWEALRRSHLIPVDKSPASSVSSKRNSVEINPALSAVSPSTGEEISVAGPSGPDGKTAVTPAKGENTVADIVDPSKITLDTPVKESGSNFSQGQRQLIALARALVRQSKIIVMDEATASVDFETDLKIQTTIREEMADATVITIAHRIRTIADFDRVLVMSAGEIVEFDKPYTLMQQDGSQFRSMCERSSEFDVLLAIAEAKERKDREE